MMLAVNMPHYGVAEGLLVLALLVFCAWSIGSTLVLVGRECRERRGR